LLLLGTGDSGKSTFARQMRIVHKAGLPQTEFVKFQSVLRENCLDSMKKIFTIADGLGINTPSSIQKQKNLVVNASELNPKVADAIVDLWENELVKETFSRRSEYNKIQVLSACPYYFKNCRRFAEPDFRPTDTDITHAKLRTTGVVETKFKVEDTDFTMVDVGGQRSERRKWLHCFQSVTAVLYLAALDEYNMTLEEDNTTNRMEESAKHMHSLPKQI
jgi:hypothetical protein